MSPDYNVLSRLYWGSGDELAAGLAGGSNIALGANPPYGPADFLEFYPKFAGVAANLEGTLTVGSAVVSGISTSGIAAGSPVSAAGLPPGSVIASVDSETQVTLLHPATASGVVTLTVFDPRVMIVPLPALSAYIALASSSLSQARWQDCWKIAMGLYVAHFLTLWLRSDGDMYSTPGQAAAAGLARGVKVSKGAGPASVGIQTVTGLESWGAWTQTEYGVQFAQFAKIIGGGPMLIW